MLIDIDADIENAAPNLGGAEWSALNNLALGAREGNHMILSTKRTAAFLSNHSHIGERERAFFRTLETRHSTLVSARSIVQTRISATLNQISDIRTSGSSTIIEVPLSFFARSSAIQPAILLGENLDDCALLIEIARAFAHVTGYKSVRTAFEKRPGGGDTTSDVARQLLEEDKRILLVYVDSDRITPKDRLGSTALKVQRVYNEIGPVWSKLFILACKDLENLLPGRFFQEKFSGHPDHSAATDFLENLEQKSLFDSRLYIDIKKGLLLEELLHPARTPNDFNDVWDPVIQAIATSDISTNPLAKDCARNRQCKERQACSCKLAGANNTNLLSEGAALYSKNQREYWISMKGKLRAAIEEVGRAAFDWGCAMQRQSS